MADYTGTNGDDSHWGGVDGERIEGLGGGDYLLGNGGNDEILGGDGDDNLHGSEGNDIVDGGDGNDGLQGNEGTDTVRGMGGDDRLLFLYAPQGDLYDGGEGVDTLQFDAGLSMALTFSIADPSVAQDLYGATVVHIERLAFRSGSGNDQITGGALDDYINGYSGDDWIDGGLGNDSLDGDSGIDTIHGGGGNDTIRGGYRDLLYGDEGDDTLQWSDDALIDGGAGFDHLRIDYTGLGSDLTLDLSDPSVEVTFHAYGDTRIIGVERLTMSAGSANDNLTGGSRDDVLVGNAGDDMLAGGAGNDTLGGGDGADQLIGGAGDDFLHNYSDAFYAGERFDGGDGFDRLEFQATNSTAAITIDLLAGGGMVTNIEQISFGAFGAGKNTVSGGSVADFLSGGSAGDYFHGRGGDDAIRANGGNDIVYGGDGNDYIEGDNGANSLYGDDGNDVVRAGGFDANHLDGGAGDDEVQGGAGADKLNGGAGHDWLDGGAGADEMKGGKGEDIYFVDIAGDKVIELDAQGSDLVYSSVTFSLAGQYIEVLNLTGTAAINGAGNGLHNRIVGNGAANTLLGLDGNDRLDGGGGADTLRGGLGNDILVVDNAADTILEYNGEGTDTVEAWINFSLAGQYVETLKLMGTADLNATGNGQVNTLVGNSGANTLNGGAGADAMSGGAGDDRYIVDDVGDTVSELLNQGNDTVEASVSFSLAGQYVETLILTGSVAINAIGTSQANTLWGNSAINILRGEGGNDALHGGLGNDELRGGARQDGFWFETAPGAGNVDRITDFVAADDSIFLDRTIFTGIAADGALAAGAFCNGTVAADVEDRILYDAATGNIWYDADGSGAGVAKLFAQVTAGLSLTAADFIGVP